MIKPAQEKDIEQITEIYNYAILNTTATFDTEPKTCEDRYRWFHEHTGYHLRKMKKSLDMRAFRNT